MVYFHYSTQRFFLSWMISLFYLKPFSDFLFHCQWPPVASSLAWFYVILCLWSHLPPFCPSLIHSSYTEDPSVPSPPGMLSSQGLWTCCALCLSRCSTLATLDIALTLLVYLFFCTYPSSWYKLCEGRTSISFACDYIPRTSSRTVYVVGTL